MIKVLLVDDQELIREGIKYILEQDGDITVVGAAGNGHEALRLCNELQPDVILMDIVMPGSDGVEGTRLIKTGSPGVKIIVLTTFDDDEKISRALQNGADGYILKDIKPDELIMTVKSTLNGLRVIHQNVFNAAIKQFNSSIKLVDETAVSLQKNCNERELEIILLIVYGKNNKEIAETYHLSEGRIKNIISQILKKMDLKDRTQLAIYAVKNKLV